MRHDDRRVAGGLAMISLSIEGDREFERLAELVPAKAQQAISRALSRTLRQTKTKMSKAEAEAHGMPVPPLRKVRTKARRGVDSGLVWFGYNPIAAAYVGGLKAPTGVDGAFVATMPTGHTGLFRRKGRARLPIEEVKLPLPQAVVVAERMADAFGVEAEEILAQELEYALLGRP